MGTPSEGQRSHLHLPLQPHSHSARMWAGSSARGHTSVAVSPPPTGHGGGGPWGISSSPPWTKRVPVDMGGPWSITSPPTRHGGSMGHLSSSQWTWGVCGAFLLLPMDMEGPWGIFPLPNGHGRSMGRLSSSNWTREVHGAGSGAGSIPIPTTGFGPIEPPPNPALHTQPHSLADSSLTV